MKVKLYCEDCDEEFVITHKTGEEVKYCVFCGTELILEWNSDAEGDD